MKPVNHLGQNEISNILTHLIGLILAFFGLIYLVVTANLYGNGWHIVSCSIYGATLVLLYAASTVYHSVQRKQLKHLMKIVDHSSIYLLIAGSYTPFALVNMNGVWGWSLFGGVWGLALFGIVFKIFFVDHFNRLSVFVYLLMGWSIVIAAKPAIEAIPMGGLILLGIGGGVYTVGVIFFIWDHKIRFGHTIWHLFVLTGSIFHYLSVVYYVLPQIS